MSRKYASPLTAKLTPDNWDEHVNVASMSLDDILDLMGDLKKMEALAKKVGGFAKEALKAKMPPGDTEFVGSNFQVQLNDRVRKGGLNRDLITEEMGEEWVEDHSNPPTEYTEVRVKPVQAD